MCNTLSCPLYFVINNTHWKPKSAKLNIVRNKGWKQSVTEIGWIERIFTLKRKKWIPLILDTCMLQRITTLRNQGINTIGCCCGHGISLPDILVREIVKK